MEMLHYDFMQRAFLAGGLIALVAPVLGIYLLLRRQALMADMLSHVSLAGVAAGVYFHLNPTLTGFGLAVAGAAAGELVRRSYRTYSEVSVAIIMIGGLSLAILLMSLKEGVNKGFTSYLFGSVVAVNQTELLLLVIVVVLSGAYFYILRRPLYHVVFDEVTARTSKLPVGWITSSFSILTGMIVAAAMPIVGVLLVSSLIVLPAALAIRIARSFQAALVLAVCIGVTGVLSGLAASYELSTPPGGTIALVLAVMLAAGVGLRKCWLFAAKRRSRVLDIPAPAPAPAPRESTDEIKVVSST